MSVSKWRYTEACDGMPCVGDCDFCSFDPEEPLTGLGREIPKDELHTVSIDEIWEDDDEDDYDPNPVLLHIETDNLDYDVNEEDVSWHWKRLDTYRSATYEELIKAWEREKGYKV